MVAGTYMGAGVVGHVVAVAASISIVGSAIVSFSISAFEATLYLDSLETLKRCGSKE